MNELKKLSWAEEAGGNNDVYLAEINSHLPAGVTVVDKTAKYSEGAVGREGGTFELTSELQDSEFVNVGYMNPTDKFVTMVTEVSERHFNTKPGFNNTGEIFWIIK